ncbi:helix-hairpin-helix domain-containing protein [Flavobacterium sp. CAU 1735]|uniref:ComEA family DNA-binding protein n=1 Tax=Flavobacterium sp. CAU 1735 TaxID=3140361 RepID=UPI0032612C0A
MDSNNKYGLKYTRAQRSGIFVLLLVLLGIQLLIYFTGQLQYTPVTNPEAEKWLSQQITIDSLKRENQASKIKLQPFNPNFISDYKGYMLGMTVAEIDRLQHFRSQNKYVNSIAEFRQVTQMDEKRLAEIAPYFKFPDWVNQKTPKTQAVSYPIAKRQEKKEFRIDINKATREELRKIYGIGEALSERIIKEKEKFGAFVSTEQFRYIRGLSDEVVEQLIRHFPVLTPPEITKIDINNASLKELAQFPYFRYGIAKQMITYRSMIGPIKSKEDLTKIKEFPVEKVDIIALYLDF